MLRQATQADSLPSVPVRLVISLLSQPALLIGKATSLFGTRENRPDDDVSGHSEGKTFASQSGATGMLEDNYPRSRS